MSLMCLKEETAFNRAEWIKRFHLANYKDIG